MGTSIPITDFVPAKDAPEITCWVNNRLVKVKEGSSILAACRDASVYVPTLCYHPMLSVIGQCRVCMVEVSMDGGTGPPSGTRGQLVPSCATKVKDGMRIRTHSPRVTDSVTSNLQFLSCRHPHACTTCEANGHCELQDLAYRYDVHEVLPTVLHHSRAGDGMDTSSPAIHRDMNKCVLCSRCVRVCSEIQGMNILGIVERGEDEHVATVGELPLNSTACIACGQCTAVCPVGALYEKPSQRQVQTLLANAKGNRILVAQTAPAVRVALSEEFGLSPGSISTGKMVGALKQLGFDYVFDTNFAADLTIMEEATEFVERLTGKSDKSLPMFTSCCPAWINLCEKTYPALLPHLSTCKSPQAMMSTMIRTFFADKLNVSPDRIVVVSMMPCVAKKDEITRPQLTREVVNEWGATERIQETDYVLTTRELGNLIHRERIPFQSVEEMPFDTPLGLSTGAAALFGATGGVMEAALRTAHWMVTGKDLEQVEMHDVRALASGHHNLREATVEVGDAKLNVAVATGTKNVRKIVEQVLDGTSPYDLIEVMACPGGCVGGGGEPKTAAIDPKVLRKRINAIRDIDGGSEIRMSHHNPAVQQLYADFLQAPQSHKAHELLHTHYTDRSSEVVIRSDVPWSPMMRRARDKVEADPLSWDTMGDMPWNVHQKPLPGTKGKRHAKSAGAASGDGSAGAAGAGGKRGVPSSRAAEHVVGAREIGVDGSWYEVAETKNGRRMWKKQPPQ